METISGDQNNGNNNERDEEIEIPSPSGKKNHNHVNVLNLFLLNFSNTTYLFLCISKKLMAQGALR